MHGALAAFTSFANRGPTCAVLLCAAGVCIWPCDFGEHNICYLRGALPLWRMATGDLPGFNVHSELLLQLSAEVEPVWEDDGVSMHSERSAVVGPLGSKRRLLSSPILR
jgi:hypothetical protein